ncbi:MAG: ABC transporter ATP-binding protein [Gammaproteobacteria bacterium]|nr:ABC transporter ATP-binding protein [Gammaproteobacteria bacterium]
MNHRLQAMGDPNIAASLANVTKRYRAITALDDVSLDIRAGEAVAVLGPNGAGKTTAVGLLLGTLRPDAGHVRVLGGDPTGRRCRQRIGAMLQISGVPATLRVREHVDLFRSYYPAPLDRETIIAAAGLGGLEHRLYGKLSGGEKQRLHLALALCGKPDLLFLDEPTSSLDVESRRALWQEIRAVIDAGRTVVLTTHNIEEADALADRIVLLDRGKIIASGTPTEIKRATAASRISAVTTLATCAIGKLPGVTKVHRDARRTEIFASSPEPVVRALLGMDHDLTDLEVSRTTLEEAFLTLVRPTTGAARSDGPAYVDSRT